MTIIFFYFDLIKLEKLKLENKNHDILTLFKIIILNNNHRINTYINS